MYQETGVISRSWPAIHAIDGGKLDMGETLNPLIEKFKKETGLK